MTSQTKAKDAQGVKSSTPQAASSRSELLPVFADLQRRMMATVKGGAGHELQEVSQALAPDGDQRSSISASEDTAREAQRQLEQHRPTPGVTLTIGWQDVEPGFRAVLHALVEAMFSDAQRQTVQTESEKVLRSLVAASRKAKPDAAAMREARGAAGHTLEEMYDSLFSAELRNQTLQDGERLMHSLRRGDLPTARRDMEKALLSLTERRASILASHWEQVFRTVMNAATTAAPEKAPSKTEKSPATSKAAPSATSKEPEREEPKHENMPKTLARSDQRAQTIWTRAYTKAAQEHGEGRKAERAAYNVLKEQYERKGERWVKKES